MLEEYKNKKFIWRSLNWLHPIKAIIAREVEILEKHPEEIRSRQTNKLSSKTSLEKLLKVFKIKAIYFLISNLLYFLSYFLHLIYWRFRYKKRPINFSIDNLDLIHEGKYFNPYSDNLNYLSNNLNITYICHNRFKENKKSFFDKKAINRYISAFTYYSNILSKRENFDSEKLYKFLDNDHKWIHDTIKNELSSTYNFYLFFTFFFKIYKPKQIFLYDSYEEITFGLIAAAKKNKIYVIENQHGIINSKHHGYNYNLTNKEELVFVPDQLNYYTKPLIDKIKGEWILYPKLQDIKISLSYELWKRLKNSLQNSSQEELINLKSGRKLVTVLLSDEEKFPKWLIDTLININNQCFICIRLHPRYRNNQEKIKEICRGLTKSDYVISSAMNLFDLLEISDYCLSYASSALIDFLVFQRPAICISESGKEIFEPYIEDNLILMATNSYELEKIILK